MKPNFKNHPFNYFFSLLLFLSAYSIASTAIADGYQQGYFWTSVYGYVRSPQQAADDFANSRNWSSGGQWGNCSGGGDPDRVWLYGFNCGSVGYSTTMEKLSCVGHEDETYCSLPGCDFDQPPAEILVQIPGSESPSDFYGTKVVIGNCVWTPQQTNLAFSPWKNPDDGSLWLKETYVPFSDVDPSDTETVEGYMATAPEVSDLSELDADNREDTYDKTIDNPIVTQVGDSTQTVEVETETEVVAKGTTVESSPEKVVITEFGGVRKEVTTTTITTTHPDGSSDVQEVVETTYTQVPGEKVTYNTDTSSVNWTAIPGQSSGTTKTTNTSKNSQGEVTAQTSNTSRSGGGGSDAKPTDEFCQVNPNDPSCAESEPGLFGTIEGDAGSIMTGFLDTVATQGIVGDLSEVLSPGGLNDGTCPIGSFDAFGHSFQISWHCDLYDDIKPTLELVAKAGWVLLGAIIVFSA